MRKAFVETIVELASVDNRVVLLTADLGFSVLEPFAQKFPTRFFNVGIAEQNMAGLATGLAKEGFIPFIYSMGTFVTQRPYEMLRNGPILHQLPVRFVGVGAGFDYGTAGMTHHSLEDVAILRPQPGVHIYSPADSAQARTIIKNTFSLTVPIYYRLGKDERPDIPGLNGQFSQNQVQLLQEGRDVCLLTTGRMSDETISAAQELKSKHNIDAAVYTVAQLNPGPTQDMEAKLKNFRYAVSIEAHYVQGGLGSLVAEVISDHKLACHLLRLGVKEVPRPETGDNAFLQASYGLSKENIIKSVIDHVKQNA